MCLQASKRTQMLWAVSRAFVKRGFPYGFSSKRASKQGVSESDLLRNYPGLTAEDLVNAWDYFESHRSEIENQIAENELDD